MPEPGQQPVEKGVMTVVCPECGELRELKDPRLVVLALHLMNVCPATAGILHDE